MELRRLESVQAIGDVFYLELTENLLNLQPGEAPLTSLRRPGEYDFLVRTAGGSPSEIGNIKTVSFISSSLRLRLEEVVTVLESVF